MLSGKLTQLQRIFIYQFRYPIYDLKFLQ